VSINGGRNGGGRIKHSQGAAATGFLTAAGGGGNPFITGYKTFTGGGKTFPTGYKTFLTGYNGFPAGCGALQGAVNLL
jgi:hypothetical protein